MQKVQSAGIIQNVYNTLIQVSAQVTGKMDASIFSAMQSIFFNSLAFSLVGIILVFWLFNHMKAGFSRDDLFKGGVWLIYLCCIYAIMTSFSAYSEFKSLFLIPQHIMKACIGSFAGTSDAGAMLDRTFSEVYDVYWAAQAYGADIFAEQNWIFDDPDFLQNAVAYIAIGVWWITIGFYLLIIIGIFIMQIASNFALSIFGCLAPMLIWLLLIPQTRGYFFSWLKNYIAISFYIPMTMLPLLLVNKGQNYMNLTDQTLWENTLTQFSMSMVLGILAIYLLFKIPEWINIILGTQESGGGFTAQAAQSMMTGATQGMVTGASMGANTVLKGAKTGLNSARFTKGLYDGLKGNAMPLNSSDSRKKGANIGTGMRGLASNGFNIVSSFYNGRK